MWKCKQCGYKNNNSSERCHGNNCKAERKYEAILDIQGQRRKDLQEKRSLLDFCPRCKKETTFEYLRQKDRRKTFRCLECNAVCFHTEKGKPVLDLFAKIGSGVVKP